MTSDPSRPLASAEENTCDPEKKNSTRDSTGESACDPDRIEAADDTPPEPSADTTPETQTRTSEGGTKQAVTFDPSVDQNTDQPRKRSRVQAAASRLLPISSGASESCSEVLHRMNWDHVSHQVCTPVDPSAHLSVSLSLC